MAKARCESCDRNFKNEEGLQMHKESKHGSVSKNTEGKKKSSKGIWIIAGVIGIIVIIVLMFSGADSIGQYDSFAQCLTDNNVVMYGAYWCPNCQQQKTEFGSSWKDVNYVECSLPNRGGQTAECSRAGIQAYPTWEFGDGSRVSGFLDLDRLSSLSGCAVN